MQQPFNMPVDQTGMAPGTVPPSAGRRRTLLYILPALLAAIYVLRNYGQPTAEPTPAPPGQPTVEYSLSVEAPLSFEPPPWWQGTWQARLTGGTWRLTLDAKGRGRVVKPYTDGYYLNLPLIFPQPGEDGLLFLLNRPTVRGEMPLRDFYLLRPADADACLLYQLKEPPAPHSPDARLLPQTQDGKHTLIGRLKRLSEWEASQPPVPGAGQGFE